MIQKKIFGTLGIWLMFSPILLQAYKESVINLLIVGIISTIAGFTLTTKKRGEGWTGAILGLWLIASVFIPFLETMPCNYCNSFLVGTIFVVIGIFKFQKEEDLFMPYTNNNKLHTHKF